ncbi:MAG TPA: CbiX/SirB N-terminal domain-containing protein [Gemmatimonadales bacterium]|nr:CbiX/SirB N-terminal domain-containing protein [Gemmatimonadales bacterium]
MNRLPCGGAALALLLTLGSMGLPVTARAQTGLLVVAHGANREWNDRVRETVATVRWERGPVALAFLMGAEKDSAGWDAGVRSLVARGARSVVVVPLMVSSFGSHYQQIRFYAGERPDLPPELAGHDHGGHHGAPAVPMRVTAALDAAPELAEALLVRWRELEPRDRSRPILLVAHGPNDAGDAERWIRNLTAASEDLRRAARAELRVGLLRDDAPPAVRAAAVAAMRDTVLALAARARDSVVALPVMISSGSITRAKIPNDLAGLPLRYRPIPLAPQPALARWIESSAAAAAAALATTEPSTPPAP